MYSNNLLKELSNIPSVKVNTLDYISLYPKFLTPASGFENIDVEDSILHWSKPWTWFKAARISDAIVHIQYWSLPTSFMLASVATRLRKLKKKVIITIHNPDHHERIPIFSFWENKLVSKADVIIVHTENGKKILKKRFPSLKSNHIQVIPHGISDIAAIQRKPLMTDYSQNSLDPARRYILFFGNIREYKGLPILLEAWKQVLKQCNDVDLIVAGRFWSGSSSLFSRLSSRILGSKKVAEKLLIMLDQEVFKKRVIFVEGFLPDSQIDSLCRIAEFCVFPYQRFSGQSGAACRALGIGVPVLVSRVGGLPELVASENMIVEPGNIQELANRLSWLLHENDWLATERVNQQRLSITKSWQYVASTHVLLYNSLTRKV